MTPVARGPQLSLFKLIIAVFLFFILKLSRFVIINLVEFNGITTEIE